MQNVQYDVCTNLPKRSEMCAFPEPPYIHRIVKAPHERPGTKILLYSPLSFLWGIFLAPVISLRPRRRQTLRIVFAGPFNTSDSTAFIVIGANLAYSENNNHCCGPPVRLNRADRSGGRERTEDDTSYFTLMREMTVRNYDIKDLSKWPRERRRTTQNMLHTHVRLTILPFSKQTLRRQEKHRAGANLKAPSAAISGPDLRFNHFGGGPLKSRVL